MKLSTQLNQDRFCWIPAHHDGTFNDQAFALVEIEAPSVPRRDHVTPTNLVVVLDRSGSMDGSRIDQAKRALCDVVDRLSPTDNFGLVIFDTEVDVVVQAGPVKDREAIKAAINGVYARGGTDLASGLIRGLKEARRLEALEGTRVLLISDGHANVGVTDASTVGNLVATYLDHRITTSSLGMGMGFDERLLSAVARQGAGNEHFAENADTAASLIAQECGELLSQAFLSCRLTVRLANGARRVALRNEFPHRTIDGKLQIDLGGFQADEMRSLVLQFRANPAHRAGRRKLATLEFEYVVAADLSEHTVTHNVWADVVGTGETVAVNGDVAVEVAFQRAQVRKRQAMESLAVGDIERANRKLHEAAGVLVEVLVHASPAKRREIEDEIALLASMRQQAYLDGNRASKLMSIDIAGKSRTRGRRP